MHARRSLRLATDDSVRVLELPYAGGDVAMLIALPDRVDGLADLELGFDAARLERWRRALDDVRVDVALPRFTIDPASPLDLRPPLTALGMPSAFDPALADFSRLDPDLYLAAAFHRVFIAVDEKGTEAAGASAAVMAPRGLPPRPIPFHVDRPFLFAIVDRPTGLLLFLGRVTDPTAP